LGLILVVVVLAENHDPGILRLLGQNDAPR